VKPATETKPPKTRWHRLLGALLEELLTPVGISVFSDFPVMSEPPEGDILLLRNEGKTWTEEQKARLPDGIRDSRAGHILIEFKYTESVTEQALRQILAYDYFYRRSRRLRHDEVQAVLISSKTPRKDILRQFGYESDCHAGVYTSRHCLTETVMLLCLNEISDEEHNAWIKCFASRKNEKQSAFGRMKLKGWSSLSARMARLMGGLLNIWFKKGADIMKLELTPEAVEELGREWKDVIISSLRPEDIDKILSGLKPEKRLEGLRPEERLSGLRPEERLSGLRPEERLSGLRPEERLSGLRPEERLSGLSPEEIEACLKKFRVRKKKHRH